MQLTLQKGSIRNHMSSVISQHREMHLGERLKSLRESHQYSQQYVADYLHIIRQTYSHYETGRINPPAKNLYALAALYEINPNALIEQENTEVSDNALTAQEQYLLYHFRQLDERDKEDIVLFAQVKSGKVGITCGKN